MTEAEALEVAGIFAANAITSFSVYITFTMAYLVAAFYTGRQLTRFQVAVASALYVFAASSSILSLLNNVAVYGEAIKLTDMGTITAFTSGVFWSWFMSTLTAIGVLVSLSFMWTIRHPKAD